MDETWRIRTDAGVRNSLLVQFLREEGVQVEWEPPDEYRGIEWANDAQQVVAMLIATGTAAAVKAGVGRFRRRYESAAVTVEPGGAEQSDAQPSQSVSPPAAGEAALGATKRDGPEREAG